MNPPSQPTLSVPKRRRHSRWIAAIALGLISSTFSTIVSRCSPRGSATADDPADRAAVGGVFLRHGMVRAGPAFSVLAAAVHAAAALLDRASRARLVGRDVSPVRAVALGLRRYAHARCTIHQWLDHRRPSLDCTARDDRVFRPPWLRAPMDGLRRRCRPAHDDPPRAKASSLRGSGPSVRKTRICGSSPC